MRSLIAHRTLLAAFFAALLVPVGTCSAHDGHDHGAPLPPVSGTIAPRADASSTDFEVVAVARGDKLSFFLDTFRENRPVDGAKLEIDAAGTVLLPVADGQGSYTVSAPFVANPGSYDLAITVAANGIVDILTTTLRIPTVAVEAAGPAISGGVKLDKTPGTLTWTAATQFSLPIGVFVGFITGAALVSLILRRGRGAINLVILAVSLGFPLQETIAKEPASSFALRDVSQRFPDGALFVPKYTQRILGLRTIFSESELHRRAIELPGRIIPDPNASGLVQASVGGRLVPPTGGFKPLGTPVKSGDILAYVRPPIAAADLTTQQQQARELDQQISVVSRKVERLRAIEKIIAKSQLEDAELEFKGLQARRANLERANKEPEPLLAPVNGVIAASNAVAGQMAEPNSIIFQIVDPTRLWVEALSFEPLETHGAAQGVLTGNRFIDLAYVGAGLADRNQSIPIHFAIKTDATGLRAGQFLTVLATTIFEHKGIAVPREAIIRGSNGQSIIYEHSNAERFVAREVRIEQLDAERVLITAGIERGKRIVTQGAELLNQIR
ncbi:MAG: efflux RND transporter periplasmic adaptor subunit [Hyphomicrobiaceae bacterium]|nr:HlyD family efflux transporter periplasmic adaptor subunit [Hyphomicrobiaceae bacterium]